jgi:hypothetical protein
MWKVKLPAQDPGWRGLWLGLEEIRRLGEIDLQASLLPSPQLAGYQARALAQFGQLGPGVLGKKEEKGTYQAQDIGLKQENQRQKDISS